MPQDQDSQKRLIFWGIFLALAVAVFLSPWASSLPDGLERVAENLGFIKKAGQSGGAFWQGAPLSDYKFPGILNEGRATALSGLLGTLAMVGLGWGIGRLLRKK
jgi:cobalt/nickel transport protein